MPEAVPTTRNHLASRRASALAHRGKGTPAADIGLTLFAEQRRPPLGSTADKQWLYQTAIVPGEADNHLAYLKGINPDDGAARADAGTRRGIPNYYDGSAPTPSKPNASYWPNIPTS